MIRPIKHVCLIPLASLMIGCTTGYEKDFSCSAFPSMGCTPTQVVFERSENEVHDYRLDSVAAEPEKKSRKARKAEKKQDVAVSSTDKAIDHAEPGDPVLTTPKNMRILFLPWEDKEKDLNIGGYVYVRLGEPEWKILKN